MTHPKKLKFRGVDYVLETPKEIKYRGARYVLSTKDETDLALEIMDKLDDDDKIWNKVMEGLASGQDSKVQGWIFDFARKKYKNRKDEELKAAVEVAMGHLSEVAAGEPAAKAAHYIRAYNPGGLRRDPKLVRRDPKLSVQVDSIVSGLIELKNRLTGLYNSSPTMGGEQFPPGGKQAIGEAGSAVLTAVDLLRDLHYELLTGKKYDHTLDYERDVIDDG